MGPVHGTHGASGINSLFGGGACSREVHGVDDVEHEGERSRGVDAVRLNTSHIVQRKQREGEEEAPHRRGPYSSMRGEGWAN